MGAHKLKNLRKPIKKATKQQKKVLADHVVEVRADFIRTIKSYSFWKRLGIAWDILIKGK